MSASNLCWRASGKPDIHKKFKVEQVEGSICSTCGDDICGSGALVSSFDNSSFSERQESFRYKSKHVCIGCAWLYGAGPSKPGNFFSTSSRYEQTVMSTDSVVKDKRPWMDVLREAAQLPPETLCTGVLTTDVKPRLWPRAQVASIGSFGLFVHAPDYDVSSWIDFDLIECLDTINIVLPALELGFAKTSLYHGLLRDFGRFSKHQDESLAMEYAISEVRGSPAFLPAILIAGITKKGRNV